NVSNMGVVNGDKRGKFNPKSELTRAELAAMVVNMEKYVKKADYLFHDVSKRMWYAEAIKNCYSNGIVKGYTPLRFRPYMSVTREEFAAVLNNIFNYNPNYIPDPIAPNRANTAEDASILVEMYSPENYSAENYPEDDKVIDGNYY